MNQELINLTNELILANSAILELTKEITALRHEIKNSVCPFNREEDYNETKNVGLK